MRFVDSLNQYLDNFLKQNNKNYIIGEDIVDPYGGAFKVTKNLSTKFPQNVFSMPISESSIIGFATGLALQKNKVIAEIMFGDFLALGADQIINHLSKFSWMYQKEYDLNVTIRVPVGGYRGYGPTHSQSLENLYFNCVNLYILSPSLFVDPGQLLLDSINELQKPKLFLENKSLYSKKIITNNDERLDFLMFKNDKSIFPITRISQNLDEFNDQIIITHGGFTSKLFEIQKKLFLDHEIDFSIISPSLIKPFPFKLIEDDIKNSKRIMIFEETSVHYGWSSEIAAQLYNMNKNIQIQRIGAKPYPIPAARHLEEEVLPSDELMYNSILSFFK
tara:strand:+ start:1289 stop:2287 length:999 start_codon:yes stop_codon:yes gene_type:complete